MKELVTGDKKVKKLRLLGVCYVFIMIEMQRVQDDVRTCMERDTELADQLGQSTVGDLGLKLARMKPWVQLRVFSLWFVSVESAKKIFEIESVKEMLGNLDIFLVACGAMTEAQQHPQPAKSEELPGQKNTEFAFLCLLYCQSGGTSSSLKGSSYDHLSIFLWPQLYSSAFLFLIRPQQASR